MGLPRARPDGRRTASDARRLRRFPGEQPVAPKQTGRSRAPFEWVARAITLANSPDYLIDMTHLASVSASACVT